MSTYSYKDSNKQLIANHMDNVENVSFRETMIKFHASSMVPVLKAYLKMTRIALFLLMMKL